ncbi:unnamed protein product [Chilo suppressalis]|uniref:Uncharacterized protein n=1 Tax=Chilo suppressalis TaxID=168631 RepID=A0ABN8AXQ0_CHISP|nr:unnamed protein product [Chilo suppressalis]
MIHVGVSGLAKCLTLEMQAHKKGYQRLDYYDTCPAGHVCPAEGANRLHTKLNVERLCKDFNDACSQDDNTQAVPSKDAGRYLCEYIYYTSLSIDNSCTLFVHVPDMEVYSSQQTARGLERILALCLEQLRKTDTDVDINEKLKDVTLEKDNRICTKCIGPKSWDTKYQAGSRQAPP